MEEVVVNCKGIFKDKRAKIEDSILQDEIDGMLEKGLTKYSKKSSMACRHEE